MPTPKNVPLTDLPAALMGLCPDQSVPSYRALYLLTLDGKMPAVRVKNRWTITDIRKAAEAAGLTVAA